MAQGNKCPNCGNPIPNHVYWCYKSSSRISGGDKVSSWMIVGLIGSIIFLAGNACDVMDLAISTRGDRFGELPWAILRGAILLGLTVWLGFAISLRSEAPTWRKLGVFRACLGMGLGAAAIGLSLERMASYGLAYAANFDVTAVASLGITGLILIVLGLRTVYVTS